jgi:peptidoglycan/xylan/chitin deacetylase (PgdA/CDA1 family)
MTMPRAVVTTSWDDGHHLDSRLAELLRHYGVAGTFYIAPRNVEIAAADRLSAAGIRELAAGFEIGGHTLRHLRLPRLSLVQARDEIRTGRQELEDLVGVPVTSFCYPCGDYEAEHVRVVADLGFSVARTVRRNSLGCGSPLEMTTTVNAYRHLVDGPVALRLGGARPWRALPYYASWDTMAMRWFDLCLERGGVYHLWGHSWEVHANGDWARLERVLAYISSRPAVRYVPNSAVPDLAGTP